jgi:hypothetical protein
MLTEASLRDLLGAGYETTDTDFVARPQANMSRTVYFMTQFLAERQYRYISSVELQRRIDDKLGATSVLPTRVFNPVDWFSAQWTLSETGAAADFFDDRYREFLDRDDSAPANYRIKPALFESVVRILSDLSTNGRGETPRELSNLAEQLDKEGVFNPTSPEDARVRVLRGVVVREGQPQFRAALLEVYGRRCAITACDAAPALEAAHVKPYEGVLTNVVTNGILLRADIHTLFDLDLIGIEPSDRLVHISNQLGNTVYREFEGARLRGPNDPSASLNAAALAWRWERFLSLK